MMITRWRSHTLAAWPNSRLKTPMVPGPQTSWVIRTSAFTHRLSPACTRALPASRARIVSVKVMVGYFYLNIRTAATVEIAEVVVGLSMNRRFVVPALAGLCRLKAGLKPQPGLKLVLVIQLVVWQSWCWVPRRRRCPRQPAYEFAPRQPAPGGCELLPARDDCLHGLCHEDGTGYRRKPSQDQGPHQYRHPNRRPQN